MLIAALVWYVFAYILLIAIRGRTLDYSRETHQVMSQAALLWVLSPFWMPVWVFLAPFRSST